jgi:hypothetical protein
MHLKMLLLSITYKRDAYTDLQLLCVSNVSLT